MMWRLQCLTPLLVGDGSALSPIDYMVWKDHVNVLDQRRIFRLLAKGPRLENYLTQVKRADKLDFASWGGFAQNFAERRVPFEHPAYAVYWERVHSEFCHIPTFTSSTSGPYLPASALRGALRTALLFSRVGRKALNQLEQQLEGERPPRHPADGIEQQALGRSGHDLMKPLALGDSRPTGVASLRIYLLRTATLVEPRNAPAEGEKRYGLGWKQSPRGTVDGRRLEESTPVFAEMAAPGTLFEGECNWRTLAVQDDRPRKSALDWPALLAAANDYAEVLLSVHRQFAEWSGLPVLARGLDELKERVAIARQRGNACLLSMGWASGLSSKTAWPKPDEEQYRQILAKVGPFSRAIRTGMPFPKTRRIVFLGNHPAALPGWVWLEVS